LYFNDVKRNLIEAKIVLTKPGSVFEVVAKSFDSKDSLFGCCRKPVCAMSSNSAFATAQYKEATSSPCPAARKNLSLQPFFFYCASPFLAVRTRRDMETLYSI
jgi:hypothetical protein